MEYVVVSYPDERDVFIDGQLAGKTNSTLMVESSHHIFDLGEPADYEPTSVERLIADTTSLTPIVIDDFHPGGDDT